jgi:hypothetical protein
MSERRGVLLVLALALASGRAAAQTAPGPPNERDWSLDASAYTYIVPDSENYVQPTVAADRGWLHLEARFNYENVDTGSAWLGCNLSVGDNVMLEITPMVGAVFGETDGIAPGFRGSLSWRKLELYSETEYVFDARDSADSFLYTWSELAVAPTAWSRVGLAVQRTKVYETEFDIQRGFLAGFSYKRAEVTAYLFNPDASPTVVIAASVGL